MANRAELEVSEVERLGEIWRNNLPDGAQASVGDFFESGGESLGATMLLIEIKEVFGVDVPLEVFFDAPTLAALAKTVAKERTQ